MKENTLFPELRLVQYSSCDNSNSQVQNQQPLASTPFVSIPFLAVIRQVFPQEEARRNGIADKKGSFFLEVPFGHQCLVLPCLLRLPSSSSVTAEQSAASKVDVFFLTFGQVGRQFSGRSSQNLRTNIAVNSFDGLNMDLWEQFLREPKRTVHAGGIPGRPTLGTLTSEELTQITSWVSMRANSFCMLLMGKRMLTPSKCIQVQG